MHQDVILYDIQSLLKTLHNLCPKLLPFIIPKDFSLPILRLFQQNNNTSGGTTNRQSLQSNKCHYCQEKQAVHLSTKWEVNIKARSFLVLEAYYLCSKCYLMNDLEGFLNKCVNSTNPNEIKALVQHFVNVNNAEQTNQDDAIQYVQQCYSLAFSLKNLLSSLTWKVVDITGENFSGSSAQKLMESVSSNQNKGTELEIQEKL